MFVDAALVQLVNGAFEREDAEVAAVAPAQVTVSTDGVTAEVGTDQWCWPFDELSGVHHGRDQAWTLLIVPGVPHHGVAVDRSDVEEFRLLVDAYSRREPRGVRHGWKMPVGQAPGPSEVADGPAETPSEPGVDETPRARPESDEAAETPALSPAAANEEALTTALTEPPVSAPVAPAPAGIRSSVRPQRAPDALPPIGADASHPPVGLEARDICAWFGAHHVLDRVSLDMRAGEVTALIGPSGCGKSTFLRILNRMHEMIPSASLAGEVLLDGVDIYDPARKLTDARRQIGMVFQKPNPFPAMSIYDNVVAGFQLTGTKVSAKTKDDTVESCLRRAGVWSEVRDRLRQPGGSLSGGQQQRLCIARALAIRPKILLMDEPCSALDPTSTRRIEQTIGELRADLTIVIVTHNMQQAARVSDACAFFLAEQGTPGVIVEHGPTESMFGAPQDPRTSDYVNGRFG